jgi:hypothetical protein
VHAGGGGRAPWLPDYAAESLSFFTCFKLTFFLACHRLY